MWYLIIPPVIVITSLSFVLWYFSRKGADPSIAEKAFELDQQAKQQVPFMRTKAFFLRLLEKGASRFKILSLKMHNALHTFTQSMKTRQRYFQEKANELKMSQQEQPTHSDGILARFRKKTWLKKVAHRQAQEASIVENNSVLQESEKTSSENVFVSQSDTQRISEAKEITEEREAIIRPMVSATVVHPEQVHKHMRGNVHQEEVLIARIAADPRDFEAYEKLGDYYLEAGNIKDAKECYRQVLRLSPAHRMVKIKVRRLEKMLAQTSM